VPQRIGIVGLGTMGSGIAITSLLSGHDTVAREVDDDRLRAGVERVRAFFEGGVRRGKLIEEQRDAALGRLQPVIDLQDLAGCDVVIEAVHEDLAAKVELFGTLDNVCGPEAVFATNTSTLSVTGIAAGSRRPDRVIGTHFCNPAPLMKLVEVVRGRLTSERTYERTLEFVASLDKVAVTTEDTPGFLVNLFLVPFENDCIRALEAGRGTVESIERMVTSGLGHPMGPFTLLDVVGLDIHRAVSMSLYDQLRDPRFAPPPLVDRMIAAGHLGRKTGRGFYDYGAAGGFGD
jgi:3-hydroxybutyryl-CoA dehydrogenase